MRLQSEEFIDVRYWARFVTIQHNQKQHSDILSIHPFWKIYLILYNNIKHPLFAF